MSSTQIKNDSIEINGIRVSTIIGVLEQERISEQPIQIDLLLELDLHDSSINDELGDTVNYGEVTEKVYNVAKESKDLLLERLAQRIADEVLIFERVISTEIKITKIRPPIPVDVSTTSVRIHRKQNSGPQPLENHEAVIALGSNMGDRLEFLRFAVESFETVKSVSSIYETEPIGGPDGQDSYLNLVIVIETPLDPYALLRKCQRIEASAMRQRNVRWGPRTLDVDVIFYEDVVINSERLTIPHPRYHQRRFVLKPLSEIASEKCPLDWDTDLPSEKVALYGALDLERHEAN